MFAYCLAMQYEEVGLSGGTIIIVIAIIAVWLWGLIARKWLFVEQEER